MLGAIVSGDLRVEFFRSADRVAHRVLFRGVPIAESIEGTPDEDWPASPPFQEVHFERVQLKTRREPGDIGFLVGMAGRSHWSASVEPRGPASIAWEVACRLHGPPEWLGVRYRLLVPCVQEREDTVLCRAKKFVPVVTRYLRFTLDATTTKTIAISSEGEFDLQGDELSLRFPTDDGAYPRTQLLSYQIDTVLLAAAR